MLYRNCVHCDEQVMLITNHMILEGKGFFASQRCALRDVENASCCHLGSKFYINFYVLMGQNEKTRTTCCRSALLGGSVSAPTVAFSSFSVAAELPRLLLATGRIWMWNFLGSSSSKSESLE